MKALFVAVMGKSSYKKWKVIEPDLFYFLFYVQFHEIMKTVVGVACSQRSQESIKSSSSN